MNSPAQKRPIRVLVADDSAFMRTALARMIQSDPNLQVIDTAVNGIEALEKIQRLQPDVVTLDIEMPRMNGLETLRHIMAESPRPVIMVSSLSREGAEVTLDALDSGAFDYVSKDLSCASLDIVRIREELIAKIRSAALSPPAVPRATAPVLVTHTFPPREAGHPGKPVSVVAIGTSTGGPRALQEVLAPLPANLPAPILIVQHMPAGFTGPFAARLNALSNLNVKEASADELIELGAVYIAPAGWHMTVNQRPPSRCHIRLAKTPEKSLHMPSVDVMMLSVAETFGAHAMGVILTGMGADGAEGMKAIHAAGGLTVGQDAASCAVYGMPRACAELGILQRVVPLQQVPAEILSGFQLPPKKLT